MNSPNEEIQLEFIGPITENYRRVHILLSIAQFSEWPAASFCKYTDGETAVKFLEEYIHLNGIPKTNRTDKAIAFTGRFYRDFCKAGERDFCILQKQVPKSLDVSLYVLKKTPHSKPKNRHSNFITVGNQTRKLGIC